MSRRFALIPAAGTGSRMGGPLPKQYLGLLGQPMLYHALAPFCRCPAIEHVYVVLSPEDDHFDRHDWSDLSPRFTALRCGGESRAASVRNGLAALVPDVAPRDWMLVHDAARPCLSSELLGTLLSWLDEDALGGLLALPVADTLKRADPQGRVLKTEPRADLWQAQTPQMFRYQALAEALSAAGADASDESMALERAGFAPKLITGDARNLKITYPGDLRLAELILQDMEQDR